MESNEFYDLKAKLNKDIANLQTVVNTLSSAVTRLSGEVTHPKMLGYFKIKLPSLIASASITLPVYANNAAAKTGGLTDGNLYKTATGTVMIVYT